MPIRVNDLAPSVLRHEIYAATGTTTAKLPNNGIVTIVATSGAKTFTLTAPVSGCEVCIYSISASTATLTVNAPSTGVSFNMAGANKLTFDAGSECVWLRGLSTTKYAIVANTGSVGTGTQST